VATYTSRLGLRKPASTDDVTVDADLGANFDAIDSAVSFTSCTSTTRPSVPFRGQGIYESDTGRAYVHNGTTPASAGWRQDPFTGFLPVASTTRPTAPFTGQAIYETDTGLGYVHNGTTPASAGWSRTAFNSIRRTASTSLPSIVTPGHMWQETDSHVLKVANGTTGASGGWEWPSIPVVNGITPPNPWDGQTVFNLPDRLLYIYDAASTSWRKATAYARYALTSGSVTLSPAGDVMLQFPTAIATDPRIVASGTGNSTFTLTPGRWKISASYRASVGGTFGLYLATGTAANENNGFAANSSTFQIVGVSTTVEFTTSTTVCAVAYSGAAASVVPWGSTSQAVTYISFERSL